jgi:endonuclease/exonuclease/phosphatase family metal-dependent hydrolase
MFPYKKFSYRFPVALLLLSSLLCSGARHTQAAGKQSPAYKPAQESCGKLTVMTRNMHPGTDFTDILAAGDLQTLFAEVAEAFADVQASDVPARIAAIAHEIQTTKPGLISLQEVALWQTGPFDPQTPATTVAFDYLQLLLAELAKHNLEYEPVAVLNNLDAEVPALGSSGLFDVRFTDRLVVLIRTDLKKNHELELRAVEARHFFTLLTVPTPTLGRITIPRGYIAADVDRCGETFRFINAHLESFEEFLGLPFPFFRFAQASELLQGPANSGLPVVVAGDFNADAESPADPTYQLLLSGGLIDAWEVTSPNKPGYTWPLFVVNPFEYVSPYQRLDLVLTHGAVQATKSVLVGERNVTPRRPMPSDHAGVVVDLRLRP